MPHRGARLLGISLLALSLTAAAPSRPDIAREAAAAQAARAAALAARDAATARAAEAAAAAAALSAERAKAAAHLREAESATLDAADRMDSLARDQRAAEASLNAHAAAIVPLLPLIERLALYPAETLLAVPESTEDAVRGLLVLRGISHRLEEEAAALRRQRDALRAASEAVAAEAPRLAAAEQRQDEAARRLDRQLAMTELGRRADQRESAADAARAAVLGARAANLRSLVERLDQARPPPPPPAEPRARGRGAAEGSAPLSASSGPLLVPVVGTVVRSWGAPTDAGPAVGVTYRAAPKARVLAPCSGRVAFAAPFRSYGQLLILDCGGGTDAVLAGLAALSVRAGQSLHRGEEVGAMAGWNPEAPGDRPTLYVELRRRGEPVNPAAIFKSS